MKRPERKPFRDFIRIHCKVYGLKQKDIATHFGITEQEFHNLLNGHQDSVPSKGVTGYNDFKEKLLKYLNLLEI